MFDISGREWTEEEYLRLHEQGLVQEKGFFILPSELFCNVRKKASSDANLNETLEKVFRNIETSAKGSASENSFAGLFDDFDVNSNKLGSTVAKRNERLAKLLDRFARWTATLLLLWRIRIAKLPLAYQSFVKINNV